MNAFLTLLRVCSFSSDSSSNRDLAYQLLVNVHKLPEADVAEAAEICHTSPATMSRFVKSLGFDTFSSFRKDIALSINDYKYFNYVPLNAIKPGEDEFSTYLPLAQQMLADFTRNIDRPKMEEFVDVIQSFEHIYIHSLHFSASIYFFQADLFLGGKHVHYSIDENEQYEQVKQFNDKTLYLAVKHQIKESVHMDRIISKAHNAGATVGLIVSTRSAQQQKYVDYAFTFDGTQHFIDAHFSDMYITLMSSLYQKKYLTDL